MMRSSELLIIVDSVEEAVKFYTEKLAFDIVALEVSRDNPNLLLSAQVRRGKCGLAFRVPHVEELAEFSFIKRCASRCIGLYIEVKKGLEKYCERCKKRGVKIVSEVKSLPNGSKCCIMRDPFGIKLVFTQVPETKDIKQNLDFAGLRLDQTKLDSVDSLGRMVDHLKSFGILRRAAKKYAKHKIRELTVKPKK